MSRLCLCGGTWVVSCAVSSCTCFKGPRPSLNRWVASRLQAGAPWPRPRSRQQAPVGWQVFQKPSGPPRHGHAAVASHQPPPCPPSSRPERPTSRWDGCVLVRLSPARPCRSLAVPGRPPGPTRRPARLSPVTPCPCVPSHRSRCCWGRLLGCEPGNPQVLDSHGWGGRVRRSAPPLGCPQASVPFPPPPARA